MGNKTIYIANEDLWKQAKTLSGKDGLSSVIAKALQEFVTERNSADQGYEKLHFEVLGNPDLSGPTEVIGFEGKVLYENTFKLVANPFVQSDSAKGLEAWIAIYRTKSGTFVVLAGPTLNEPTSASSCDRWESHRSVADVMSGGIIASMYPPDRSELLREFTANLGKGAVTWID